MTCDVKNVLYVMKCSGCGEEYIGQTGDYLRKRVTVHNQQIRDPRTRMLYVSGHIDTCAHQTIPKYTILDYIYKGAFVRAKFSTKLFAKVACHAI